MSTPVTMPQLGESVVEGTIAKWLVAEGESVKEDQPLVEVTTDKIDTEIPSPAAGVIGALLVAEGETVGIGTVLCEIVPAAAGAPVRAQEPARRRAAAESPAGRGAQAAQPAARGAQAPEPSARPQSTTPSQPTTPAAPKPARSTQAAPARPSAREGAVSVTRGDAYAAVSAATEAAAAPSGARPEAGTTEARERWTPTARSALQGSGVALDRAREERARTKRRPARADDGDGAAPKGHTPRVTPVVRRMAAEHDVDLSRLQGTGVGGRVTKQDLLLHLADQGTLPATAPEPASTYGDLLGLETRRPALPPPPAASRRTAAPLSRPAQTSTADGHPVASPAAALREYSPPQIETGEGDRVEPFSKRRKIIAEHMVYSKAVSPHVYTMAEVDMSRVAALREAKKRAFRDAEGVNLTYLHFVLVAAARALRDVPRMNAVVGKDELILRRDVNLGVAVETEGGLVVPVVRNADRLSLRGIARAVEDLAARARDRKLVLDDLQGGTFTVSNPGREGNLIGFAVINQPQLGILRMGEVKKRPVVVEVDGADAIVIRPIMLLSLSYDHRVIDGATGNSFLYRVKEHLEAGEFEI